MSICLFLHNYSITYLKLILQYLFERYWSDEDMEIKRMLSKKVLLVGVLIRIFRDVAFTGNRISKNEWEEQKCKNKKCNQKIEGLTQMPLDKSLNISNEQFASERNSVTGRVAPLYGMAAYVCSGLQ